MRSCSAVVLAIFVLAGCASREDRGRTVNDVWVIGECLHRHADRVDARSAQLMGQTLKAIADRQAEELGVTLDKECEACKSTPTRP